LRHAVNPPISTRPFDGRRSPDSMCRIVVLPAPFGPSRPVIPGPNANVMSLTATTGPYQRDTLSRTIDAAEVPAGASALGSGANVGTVTR
jgi:hypothetical protein